MATSTYAEAQAQAEKAYQDALAGLSRDERRLFQDYGFTGNIDDKGQTNFTIDPINQHGASHQMLNSHAMALQSMRDDLTGKHLGRTGLASQRQRLLRFIQSGDYANLSNRFQDAANSIFRNRGQAMSSRNAALLSAQLGQGAPGGTGGGGAGGGDSSTPPPNDRMTGFIPGGDANPVGPGPMAPYNTIPLGGQFQPPNVNLAQPVPSSSFTLGGGGPGMYDPYRGLVGGNKPKGNTFANADIY